jgi:hypothetical protein
MSRTKNNFVIKLENTGFDGSIQVSEDGAEQVGERIYNDVLEGRTSAIAVVEFLKYLDQISSVVKGKSDLNGEYKFVDLVRDEIKRNSEDGKSCLTKYGTKLELAETGTKYDFTACGDPEWEDLEKQSKELDTKKKEREKFLKTIGDKGLIITDEETGETKKLFPPIKTSTSSYKQTLFKN